MIDERPHRCRQVPALRIGGIQLQRRVRLVERDRRQLAALDQAAACGLDDDRKADAAQRGRHRKRAAVDTQPLLHTQRDHAPARAQETPWPAIQRADGRDAGLSPAAAHRARVNEHRNGMRRDAPRHHRCGKSASRAWVSNGSRTPRPAS
nr:hypothetical protein [Burkholderia ubonensis]